MKVLILGATGFIGLPVAQAYVRAGHIVYGQTRSQSSAVDLAAEEIIPVICDPYTDEGRAAWGKIASQVDVFVDILKADGSASALKTFHHFLSCVSRPKASPKPTYIYTGGLWSMSRGPGGLESWTDERQPRSEYNGAVGWRAEIEDPVLLEPRIHGIVIRPPIMYGRSQSFVASYILDVAFEASKRDHKTFETVGDEDTRWLTAHQDDVAELYVRVGERGPACAGQVFLAANPQTERLRDILDAVTRVSGCKGYKLVKAESPYDKAWVSTLNARASLGAALSGWYPRKMSLVDGMDVYWSSYLASKEQGRS